MRSENLKTLEEILSFFLFNHYDHVIYTINNLLDGNFMALFDEESLIHPRQYSNLAYF